MSQEVLVNVTPQETRVAVVENGVLQEVHIERTRSRGIVGNIYKGRVSRVLPGMDAAFVDIGLERAAFLHASDVCRGRPELDPARSQPIAELLREGEELLVQVVKDPLGSKGARLTTQITVPSRYLVMVPCMGQVALSQRIEGEDERERLREVVTRLGEADGHCGYIVRTAAEGAEEAALAADMAFLRRLWAGIAERAEAARPGTLVHEDLPLALRILRDLLGDAVEKIRVDSRMTFRRMREFAERYVPELAGRLEYYPGERPVFELYGVEDELKRALERRVELKSGGYLIIDQTEAMTTIDVNTGAYVGHRNLEETIFKTNLEAAQAIARQLRLRNLGGIIIVDFIDMEVEEHRTQVLQALERALARDRARTHISEISRLGLVEMTRKRTRESLARQLCEPCPTCEGRGTVKTVETVCYEIFREIIREARQFEARSFLVLAAPQVVDRMLDEESAGVAELEAFIGREVRFQAESSYTQEQYDVVLM
ncbi:ribonuclease G [Inmirania thermothiophila]|uniref:ribonuclease G n=1 Tax=Inmirania thermothiophila TaxID=1750597 RepID=UPI000F483151|nr:ribonuclease G [Inmirania thermothiophila]